MITEENFIDFKCPYCQELVSFPEADKGYARACPICAESLVVTVDGGGTGGRLPLPLSTERLILRRLSGGDWKDLLEFMGDEEVFRFTSGGPLEEDDILHWLDADLQVRLTTPDQAFYLAVQLKEIEKLVGLLSLRFADPLQASAHVIVSPGFQRRGIGREALEGLLTFCFKGIHLHRVWARCDSRNLAGVKLAERAGLRGEGEFVKDTLTPEGWLNTICFAKLEEEQA